MNKWRFYAQETITQIFFAKKAWSLFLAAERKSDIPEIFYHLQHYLIHAAQVDKLLNPQGNSDRRALINRHINLSHVDLKFFRKLRNHLEHFDERLDSWLSNYEGASFFDMNLVSGTKGFPEKAFLRALDGHIFRFHGDSYDLDLLYQSLVAIEEQVIKSAYSA